MFTINIVLYYTIMSLMGKAIFLFVKSTTIKICIVI